MTRMKKGLLWGLFVVLLLGGGVAYWVQEKEGESEKIQTAAVQKDTIEEVVSAQGTLEPKDYVDVGVQVSGQILNLYVDIGDEVEKDEILAELDPRAYQAAIDSSKAEIKALDAQIKQQTAQAEYDRAQFERSKKLVSVKAVSQDDVENKEKTLKITQASLEALNAQKEKAEAALRTNTINLGYTKIYAPMNGVIADRKANVGQTLNANQTTPTIFQVANFGVMTIRAEVAEADVMRLKPGMESTFTTLGDTDRVWKGTIRQILPTPDVVNDVVLYNALIDVENKDGALMNGMSTQNSFVVARADNVLMIPARALGERLASEDRNGGKAYRIHLWNGGKVVPRTAFIGLVTRSKAEVKDGLKEGDLVVTSALVGEEDGKTGPRMPGPRL